MSADLVGRVAVVTGGGKGVGRAVCTAFAARGAHVVINWFHSEEPARRTLAEITDAGGSAELIRASVANRSSVQQLFDTVAERHGGLDILVNNAARGTLAAFDTLRDQDWSKAMAVNLDGSRWCAQAAAPLMARRGGGSIVNLSSIGAGHVMGNYAPVGVSKAAVEALTRYLAVELAVQGIRVNTASAGLIDSANSHLFPESDALRDVVIGATPLKRLAAESDLTEIVLFLASARSSFITGQTILADGGLSLGSASLSPPAGGSDQRAAGVESRRERPSPAGTTAAGVDDGLVAVVGTGLAVPGASSPDEFWELLLRPSGMFSEPGDRYALENFYSADPAAANRTSSRIAGYLHDFRPHPDLRAEEHTEGPFPEQATRWLRHSLLQAREGVHQRATDRSAVYVGAWPGGSQGLAEYLVVESLGNAVDRTEGTGPGGRLRELLRRRYPRALPGTPVLPTQVLRRAIDGVVTNVTEALVVDTACASSLYSVDLGTKALLAGDCDIAYCGGVEVLDPTSGVMFAKLGGLSRSGQVRSFDTGADGTLFSDGASVVALKLLSRARADGDEILGVLAGFGAAADGRGKSIAAPNPTGQRLAVQRARAVNGFEPGEVQLIVAHATGTSAGDRAELESLSSLSPDGGYLCSSNKAVVGHTGWAAGTVSLIHALLVLRHGTVPGQYGFTALPPGVDSDRVRVPTSSVPFPASERQARLVGVSAFGFGGTNGHLLVSDRPSAKAVRSGRRASEEDLAVVAWSAHLPDSPSSGQVRAWLRGAAPAPRSRFPAPYPLPTPVQARLAPSTIETIDPCHLMAIQVADRFVSEHGELWADLRESVGVVTAHTGVPNQLAGAIMHAYADDVRHALDGSPAGRGLSSLVGDLLAGFGRRVPNCNGDTQPGVMTNVISSRISSRLNLRGASMTIDAGPDSSLAALDVARRYLLTGELDLALLLAVNGNTSDELAGILDREPGTLAEGAFLIAVTTAAVARDRDWPVLARLRFDRGTPASATGTAGEERAPDYLGAEGARTLLRSVENGGGLIPMPAGGTVRVLPSGTLASEGPRPSTPRAGDQPLPRRSSRYLPTLVAAPRSAAVPPVPAIPARGVVLVESAALVEQLRDHLKRARASVVCAETTEPDDPRLLRLLDRAQPSLTVICDFGGDARSGAADTATRLRLHDLTFVAAKWLGPRWTPESSAAVLLTGQPASGHPYPLAALFVGLVRSLAWERPEGVFRVVLTDAPPRQALDLLAQERSGPAPDPVTWYLHGVRHRETLVPSPLPDTDTGLPLDDDSVVLVTGGTGGIAVALLQALSSQARPTVWLLGRADLAAVPEEILTADEHALTRLRTELIRKLRDSEPDLPVRTVVRRVEQLLRARSTQQAHQALTRCLGAGRVRYLRCDVRDRDAVKTAIDTVLATSHRLDLVVHAAGVSAPALLEKKAHDTFRAVRDTKVLGHLHLKEALAAHPPARWFNIGSVAGAIGWPGDTDYASGNAYLAACAPADDTELTVSSPLWGETGFGADPVNRAYLERQGRLTPITTREGTDLFLAELASGSHHAVYLGDNERRTLQSRPGSVSATAGNTASRRRFYLREPVSTGTASASWHCRFDPTLDKYLYDHLVDGKPTVPGTLMLAIAAEAAETMVPHLAVQGFRDARFEAFIRPFTGRSPRDLRITAEVLTPPGDQPPVRVRVLLSTDITTPGGIVHSTRRHFRTEVLLGPAAAGPGPARRDDATPVGRRVSDPYYQRDSPVHLSGIFANTTASRADADRMRASWEPAFDGTDVLDHTRVPFLLLCATARTFALAPETEDRQRVFVPRGMRVVDLYRPGTNDVELSALHPSGIQLHGDRDGLFQAVAADGTVLLQLSGVEMEPMGTVGLHGQPPVPDPMLREET